MRLLSKGSCASTTENVEEPISDLAFDRHGNAFLSSSDGFYALNTQSGEVTLLFTDAAHLLSGIVFSFASETEQTLFAYDVINAEDLISFALEDGPTASDLFLNIFPSFNAGRGDLGAEVRCRQLDVVRPDVSFSRVGNNLQFEWVVAPNHSYQIRHTSDLRSDWSTDPEIPVEVADDTATGEDTDAFTDLQRFYSVEAKIEK